MLSERMREHGARCYLVNTGWTGGPYGVGNRIDITETRAMVRAAITGELDDIETWEHPVFGLHVPKEVPGVPSRVLDPRGTWPDQEAYDEQAKELARLFAENLKKFEGQVSEEVLKAGPTN
jgi:phosphoenolpyruvate carboxykinase (ATP)